LATVHNTSPTFSVVLVAFVFVRFHAVVADVLALA
jgi:hypothetical protein